MQNFSFSPHAFLNSCWLNKSLIKTLIIREVMGRYQGSTLGLMWSFFNPLLMLLVYTFVFSVIFKTRWGESGGSKAEFALILFAGLLVFNLFAECVNRAPSLIVSNTNYVKKVIFPLDILPVVIVSAAFFHTIINLIVWLLFFLVFVGIPHLTTLYFPVVLLPLIFITLGVSWLLASLGVYIRDVGQIVSVFITALMFLSPIFYPLSVLPKDYQQILSFNPLAPAIELVRAVLFSGLAPDWHLYFTYLFGSLLMAWFGFFWFQRTRKGFADVL